LECKRKGGRGWYNTFKGNSEGNTTIVPIRIETEVGRCQEMETGKGHENHIMMSRI